MEEVRQEDMGVFRRFCRWREENVSERAFVLFLAFLVGLFSAVAAFVLHSVINQIVALLTSSFDKANANWLYLVYPVIGIYLTSLFVRYIVKDNISHGITRILYAISSKRSRLRGHNCWSSVVASGITIGFGGSVGAEAPIVLTGSAIGSNLGKLFNMDNKTLMLLVGCGAAGAIAGIFKAPIAGLVFTLEVLMIDLTMASLLPILISCVTATCFTYIFSGSTSLFIFHIDGDWPVGRVPANILLGVFCGLVSLYFIRTMTFCENIFAKFKDKPYAKLALGGTTLSLLIFLFPSLFGEGYNSINLLLNGRTQADWDGIMSNSLFAGESHFLILYVALVMLSKVFATSATNGGGGCGGTFAPSLFLGCIAGYVFSALWNIQTPFGITVPSTNYALLGMAGVMSGVFHAPMTGVFLIAELTGGYDLFIPLMIVSVCSYITIHTFEPHSIYAMRLARRGELLTHHKDRSVLTLMSLDAIIDKERPLLRPDMYLGQIVQSVSTEKALHFAVVDIKGGLLGIINLNGIRKLIFRSELYRMYRADQLMTRPSIVLRTDDSMTAVMERFSHTSTGTLPVLTPEGIFVGFVSRTRLLAAYRQVLKDFSEE